MATSPPILSSPSLEVRIVDRLGKPIDGATLTFRADGISIGATRNSSAVVSIDVPGSIQKIEIVAELLHQVQQVTLDAGMRSHTFVFNRMRSAAGVGPPEARCPNGSSGRPCVDCSIGGSIVRICA